MADTSDDGAAGASEDTADLTPAPSEGGTPRRRRTLALWGVLAVLALGAGVLVVQSRDDDPPRLPIALGDASGGAKETATPAASTDMAMAQWVTYEAGDDLPLLGGTAAAYRLHGDVTEADVRAVAQAFGLEGTPTTRDGAWVLETDQGSLQVAETFGGSWSYTSAAASTGEEVTVSGGGSTGSAGTSTTGDGSAAGDGTTAVTVTPLPADCAANVGVGDHSCPAEDPTVPADTPVSDCGVPADAETGATTMQCIDPGFTPPTPTPPADLPSEEEARRIALDVLTAAGVPVDGADVHIDGPDTGWYVVVQPRVDGQAASGLQSMVAIGSKGAVSYASGYLADPERLGDYPTLDTHGAVDRLNTQGQIGYAVDDTSSGTATAEGSADVGGSTTVATGEGHDQPVTSTTLDPSPDATPCTTLTTEAGQAATDVCSSPPQPPVTIEPYPAPEPQTVVLHGAERILMLVPASDDSGDAYLVPGYRLTGDGDAVVEVVAVDDDSLLPQQTTVPDEPRETNTTVPGEVAPVAPAVGETKPDQ